MKIVTLTVIALASVLTQAANVDVAKSRIGFTFSQMNVPVDGAFKKYTADVMFDPAKPENAKIDLSIDLSGTDAGSADATQAIAQSEWFDTAHFPRASFNAKQFKALGGGRFQADGQFTLKGKTGNLSVTFIARNEPNGQWLEGSVPLSRIAWRVGTGEWADVGAIADTVQIKFKLFLPRN